MKTNHARGFVARYYDFRNGIYQGYTRTLCDGTKYPVCVDSNDFVRGIHGYARNRRGMKHKAIQQDRIAAKRLIKEQLDDLD